MRPNPEYRVDNIKLAFVLSKNILVQILYRKPNCYDAKSTDNFANVLQQTFDIFKAGYLVDCYRETMFWRNNSM
jgi:hypothetical protein